ncbi:MAG: glycosyltransferase family 9 protein [Desulfobacterales bacterium]|jgi:ADP-heptose:LPS heptosyltransferase
MDIAAQRKIDRIFGSFLCRVFSLFNLAMTRSRKTPRIDKILVILLSEMGSWVHAHAMFERIERTYPQASVSVLLFKKNREIVDLLNYVPASAILTIDPSSIRSLLGDILRAWSDMRRIRFDTVIDCELFHRISSILSFLSGAAIRVGFHPHTQEGLYRGNFINRPVLYNPYQHISRQFVTLVEAIESDTVPKAKRIVAVETAPPPQVTVNPPEIDAMRKRLQAFWPAAVAHGRKLVLIYPGGGILPIRAWPLESFCRLSADLIQDGCRVGIIGLPEDKPLADKIVSFCGTSSCADLTGFTQSVRELMVLFHLAALLITNDGGPGQFAALTPVSVIMRRRQCLPETDSGRRRFGEGARGS